MSISGTLANALSGLTAASRAAQLVSSNVSNAMTEGYGRRELELSARVTGGSGAGVQVDGVSRAVDEVLLRDRRLADAAVGNAAELSDFYEDLLDLIGKPGDPGALDGRIAGFDAALIEASARPDSEARLAGVLQAAQTLVRGLNEVSQGIQGLREDADGQIAAEVEALNARLSQVADLNGQILRARAAGQDLPGLLDQRQVLIDRMSEIVPIRQIPRENGAVALYTMTGALLLDVTPAEFGFAQTAPITPDMTHTSGALSGLTLNGQPVTTSGENAPIAGGRLAALFQIRDEDALAAQDGLDSVARSLVSRFEDAAVDPTLNPGDPGLFTDAGAALDVTDVTGLAGRLGLNSLVDPAQGGALWRLRDGLGAPAPGAVGDGSFFTRARAALSDALAPVGGGFSSAARGLAELSGDLVSRFGRAQMASGDTLAFESARRDALRETELANGVDTDQEMQKLLLIEQSYAANARVIQTADQMIQRLLEI